MNATAKKATVKSAVVEAIRQCQQAGINCIGISDYATKRPLRSEWTSLQAEVMAEADYKGLIAQAPDGIALICGPVSQGLVAIDFDDLQKYDAFLEAARATEDPRIIGLVERIALGYEESSKKGMHWLAYLELKGNEPFPGSEKWAWLETPESKTGWTASIETRAFGGFIVVAPSFGIYRLKSGGIPSIATITLDEFRDLQFLALQVCEKGTEAPQPKTGLTLTVENGSGESLFSKFNESKTWDEIIQPSEFVKVHSKGSRTYWRRADKKTGVSAISGIGGKNTKDTFCCFTSNGPLFIPASTSGRTGTTLSKFDYLMHRDYGGDFSRAFDVLTLPWRTEKKTAAKQESEEKNGKPDLLINENEDQMLREAFGILLTDSFLFRRDSAIVTPTIDRKTERNKARADRFFSLVRCEPAFVRQRLAELSTPCREVYNAKAKSFSRVPCKIPDFLPKAILGTAVNGLINPLPSIDGILHGPICGPSGELVNGAGFVECNGLGFYQAGRVDGFELPARIEKADSEEAAQRLFNLLVDYEFASPTIDRAKWLAMLLTQLCRPLVRYAPLFLVSANASRAGKTLLVDSLGIICHGISPQRIPWPGRSDKREDEIAKTVSGFAFEGKSICFWDNVADGFPLESEKLCQDLTAPFIHNRALHSNSQIGGRNLMQFIASGNNISPAGDLIGRSILLKVITTSHAPGSRDAKSFVHGELSEHITKKRLVILRDALVILAGYIRAGRPAQPGKHLGGFNDWVDLVCGSIRWATGIDPIEDQERTAKEADPKTIGLHGLAMNWREVFGDLPMKAGNIFRRLTQAGEDDPAAQGLMEAIEMLLGRTLKDGNQIPAVLKRYIGKRIKPDGQERIYTLEGKQDSRNGGTVFTMKID